MNTGTNCKVELKIPLESITSKINDLFLPNEVAGTITFGDNNKVNGISKNNGSADSVYTPNHVINYHTHPISAYNNAKTVWGWPSGEDVRETIKFALSGNKAHLVFTVEGLYTIQVSPCKVKKLKELSPLERGVLVFVIEEYFKCTHDFRGIPEVNGLAKKSKTLINPYSYIDFINNFELSNLLLKSQFTHTDHVSSKNKLGQAFGKIPNLGFLDIGNLKVKCVPFDAHIRNTDLNELYTLDKNGKEVTKINSKSKMKLIKNVMKKLFKKFDATKCTKLWNNKPNLWFHVNFFPTVWYSQQQFINNEKFVTPDKNMDPSLLTLSENPYILIFSDQQEGCSYKSFLRKNNFSTSTKQAQLEFGNFRNSTFGSAKLNLVHYQLIIHLIKNNVDSLEKLIKMLNYIIIKEDLDLPLLNKKDLLGLL